MGSTHQLAGLFVKRVCMYWQLPGERRGTFRATKVCDTEPTLLLIVLVGGAILSGLLLLYLYATRVRPRARNGPAPAPVASDESRARGVSANGDSRRGGSPTAVQAEPHPVPREEKRQAYVRLMAFVDSAMAEVDRAMPEEQSLPQNPMISANGEESGKVAAQLRAAGSPRVRSAYAAWSHVLFRFGFLARDVAEAAAQEQDATEYAQDVEELRKARSNVYALADGLRRQAAAELME